MALTPEQIAEIQRLKALMQPAATEAQRRAQAIWNAEQMATKKSKGGFVNANHKKWFGDSKVKNQHGHPMTVYHGTGYVDENNEPLREFENSWAPGYHFTDSPDAALEFARASSSIDNHVLPVHLSLKNPKVLTKRSAQSFINKGVDNQESVVNKAISKGHDGLIVKGVTDLGKTSNHYVAFHPTQIKSATGNRGTYNPNDPDITKAEGGAVPAHKRMIDDVYSKYPTHPFNPNQRAMVEGEGEDQTLGTFELKPSMSARNAVELDWLSAYPHKQGVGSRTLRKLQEHATEHGVGLTLFPWEHGGVSQSKLIKFYKKHGFAPTTKGGKAMIWRPEEKARGGQVTHAHHLEIEERPL